MKKIINEDDFTRNFLKKTRIIKEEFSIKDNSDENNETINKSEIVIDKNDEKFSEFCNNITKFVGAIKIDDKAQIVYPKDNDVVFNGAITDMNNLKFQFRYNDQGGGLYIWAESTLLTKEITEKLAKLVLIREQWKDYWASTINQYNEKK